MIEVDRISKTWGEHQVLKDVSISCKNGEICGIVGRNGSGKTVLLKCICGFVKTDKGRITISGKEMLPGEILTSAGILIEDPAFLRGEIKKL